MRKLLVVLPILGLMAAPAMAIDTPHVAGDFQGWDAGANPMTEVSAGIWEATFTGMDADSRHEFKITDGTWGSAIPGPNSWLFADDAGEITITYDSNTYDDGWSPTFDRLGLSTDPGMWTAVGDWQGWDNANPATAMLDQGGGIYMFEQVFAPGTYLWKPVVTGSWDSISWDARAVDTANWEFTTDDVNDTARMWVNSYAGTARLEIVPEPATLFGLLLGLSLLRRR